MSAVVLVSPFGLRRDFSKHLALCQRYDIPVVIDSAAGLSEKSEPLVAENCFEVYSLHATKPFPVGEGVRFVRIAAKRRPCAERSILDWKRVAHDRAAGESTASCRKCLPRLVSQCSGPLRRSSDIGARRPKFTSNYSPNTTGSISRLRRGCLLGKFSGPAPVGPGGGGIYRAGCGAEPASPLELQANPGLLAAHEQESTVAECGVTLPADGDVAGLLRYKREEFSVITAIVRQSLDSALRL